MCEAALSLSDNYLTRWIVFAYMENITDAFSQHFVVNSIEHTENNNIVKSANYHLNRFFSASAWSSHSSLIISEEGTAY